MAAPSESLPLPISVLATPGYIPFDNLLNDARNNNIALCPEDPDVLLRWYPHNGLDKLYGGNINPVDLIASAVTGKNSHFQREIDLLDRVGVSVIDHRHQTLRIPSLDPYNTVWLATVRRLTGRTLALDDPEGHHLPRKLLDYYAEETNYKLTDITRPEQFFLASQVNGLRRVELTDIEPRMSPKALVATSHPDFISWHRLAQQQLAYAH
jgi:hypothetical protein